MNTYVYVFGDPLNWTDPSGLGGVRNNSRRSGGSGGSGSGYLRDTSSYLTRQIQRFDPTFSTVGPASARGNAALRGILDGHIARSRGNNPCECGGYAPSSALPGQRVNGTDIPTPLPEAGGRPHTSLGTRIGSDGTPYRQSATFPQGGSWPNSSNGQTVPMSRVDWTSHGRSDHASPHQHPFTYNRGQGAWENGPILPFNPNATPLGCK